MPLSIRALIFDLDGVITDTIELHYQSWKRTMDEEGIPFTREDNEAIRGVSRRESLARILKGRPVEEDHAQAWMARKNDYFHAYLERMTPADALPGIRALLDDARHAGLKTAIASASRNARAVLERLDLLDQFDTIADAHCVVNTKPAPDVFLWTAGRIDVHPRQAIVFEDAEAGVTAALAGGFWTVGIGLSAGTRAHLRVPSTDGLTLPHILNALTAVSEQP